MRVRKARNVEHHRLYWAMLGNVVAATDRWPTTESLHRWIKYQLDMFTVTALKDGLVVVEWESTDFMAMGQDEFHKFFDLAVVEICLETGIDPMALGGTHEPA